MVAELPQRLGSSAERAGVQLLRQHDLSVVDGDIDVIALADIEGPADLGGKHDTAEIVDFSADTGRFHASPGNAVEPDYGPG